MTTWNVRDLFSNNKRRKKNGVKLFKPHENERDNVVESDYSDDS